MLATKSASPFPYKNDVQQHPHYTEAVLKQRAGRALIEMREKAGLSTGALADYLHMPTRDLEEIEQGRSLEGLTMSLLVRAATICKRTLKVTFTVK
jgi:DNA-binding transcriptional regulator YiaG